MYTCIVHFNSLKFWTRSPTVQREEGTFILLINKTCEAKSKHCSA
nr:MAG TPA: hypothetical protein [Caudoviricetes sp.]